MTDRAYRQIEENYIFAPYSDYYLKPGTYGNISCACFITEMIRKDTGMKEHIEFPVLYKTDDENWARITWYTLPETVKNNVDLEQFELELEELANVIQLAG